MSSDTVARLQLHVAGRLAVRVQVDETRRNDLASDVDDLNALQRLGGHRDDLSILNGHVADAVQATRGIHYATAAKYELVRGLTARACRGQEKDACQQLARPTRNHE